MRKQIASVALLAGVGLAVSLGSTAQANAPAQATEGYPGSMSQPGPAAAPQPSEEPKMGAQPGNEQPGMVAAPEGSQARIADLTRQLEDAFEKQFEQNLVNQAQLAHMISDVIQAFPQAARERVKIHIDEVFDTGQKAAGQMPPEERTKAVTPPPPEKLGKTQQHLIAGWGWGGGAGFGGLGAFGFPGMYWGGGLGWPGAWGWNSFPAAGFVGQTTCINGWCGAGLGNGGWFW
ncbi:MAG TPA: hypothetical protein VF765_04230 [Polyangiaceae bacterium]